MEHFFNHEEERLEFTAARMLQRMAEKKALDIQKVEASTKVFILFDRPRYLYYLIDQGIYTI